jgi:hypothetical protein
MPIGLDSVLLLAHVLFFCFWLGTDIGVFYSSGYVLKADIGTEARRYCLKIMNFLDQLPRLSMIGISAVGATLGILRGYFHVSPWWIAPVWLVGAVWAAAVIFLYVNEHHPEKIATVKKIDYNFRLVMIVLVLALAGASLAGVGITEDNWLALKLAMLAAIMACGVAMRRSMRTFPQYFGPMMQGTATPEQIRTAQAMMWNAKRYVLAIYALLVVAAALGLWKPI